MRALIATCHDCKDVQPVDALHDVHDDSCEVFAAHVDGREPTDAEYEGCFCPERYVCSSCCVICAATPTEPARKRH